MKEIKITDFGNLEIGNVQDIQAGTGCTVLIFKKGAAAGLDVRRGGPASEESELLKPMAAASEIHAILLSGGSAFGLEASAGVREYLEEKNVGFDVGVTKVPLVCQSCLFDLMMGDGEIRPDKKMGYQACKNAEEPGNYKDGNYGAGIGATVGKVNGLEYCMKSGIGSFAIQNGELKIGAIVAVNAFGDIYDYKTGRKVAGLLDKDRKSFLNAEEEMLNKTKIMRNKFVGNTTIGVVLTNAKFEKTKLCKIAGMARDGYARAIRPVHTSVDGDSVYAVSLGEIQADIDLVGALGANVMAEAILRAEKNAKSAYGHPAIKEL